MKDADFVKLRELLLDEKLRDIVLESYAIGQIPLDELDGLPVPPEITSEQLFELTALIRRLASVQLPYRFEGREGWYDVTRSMMDAYGIIDRTCTEGSWLSAQLASHASCNAQMGRLIEDLQAVAQMDGDDIPYERAKSIAYGQRKPSTVGEQLLSNAYRMFWEVPSMAGNALDEKLIHEIHGNLLLGTHSLPSVSKKRLGFSGVGLTKREALSKIIDMANGRSIDTSEHPVMMSSGMDSLFQGACPLSGHDAYVSWVFSKVYFAKSGLPALVHVPLQSLAYRWNTDAIRPDLIPIPGSQAHLEIFGELDFTQYAVGLFDLVCKELRSMETDIREVLDREAVFAESLHKHPEINHRQREILLQAFDNPNATFRIRPYQRMYRVVYATARADLLGLEDLGFLMRKLVGRTFVFTRSPAFEQLLDEYSK